MTLSRKQYDNYQPMKIMSEIRFNNFCVLYFEIKELDQYGPSFIPSFLCHCFVLVFVFTMELNEHMEI